jgi:Rad3-related DNA helicase
MIDLANTIANIAKLTPGGMLVFFPSYGLLEHCFETWEKHDLVKNITKYKLIFKEPKDAKDY